jgi:hypothetical protein
VGAAAPPPGGVLERLRGDVDARPRVDPNLAGGLRAWLEDEVAARVVADPVEVDPVVVDGRRMAAEAPHGAGAVTAPLALGALVATLFRQVVTTGAVDEPLVDALAGLEVDDRRAEVCRYVRDLPAPACTALVRELEAAATRLRHDWGRVPTWWLPRTDDAVVVPLAGGRVLLTGRFDLVLGDPSTGAASVCLVEVRSGARRSGDRVRRRFAALLETLRSGAPPFRVATYYSRDGSLEVDEVDDLLLNDTVGDVARALSVGQVPDP